MPENAPLKNVMVPGIMETISFNLNPQPQVSFIANQKVEMKDGNVLGQYPRSFEVSLEGHVNIIGVHLKPAAIHQLFNMPGRLFTHTAISLTDVLGDEVTSVCKELQELRSLEQVIARIEKFLTGLLLQSKATVNTTFLNSLSLIEQSRGKKSIKEIALATKTSERTLQKIFLENVGLTPKEFSRVYRFSQVIRSMGDNTFSWQYAVHHLGYYDQAHFLNDFRRVSGLNPSQFFAEHASMNKFFAEY